jgi:hypothetical protein
LNQGGPAEALGALLLAASFTAGGRGVEDSNLGEVGRVDGDATPVFEFSYTTAVAYDNSNTYQTTCLSLLHRAYACQRIDRDEGYWGP